MYSTIYHMMRLLYPGGLDMRRNLQELEQTQWMTPSELEAWQLARIQQVVKYAYEHVPYYHNLYKRLDIYPKDIKSLKDFQALPFLTREDIINNTHALVSPEMRDKVQPHSTGGSTGRPLHFFIEKSYHWWDAALEFRGRGWYGVREGDKIAWVWGGLRDMHDRSRRDRLKARILREQYLNAFSMTQAKMQKFAETLVRWKPAMFRAYPSALSLFAQYVKEHRITGIHPKFIETTAEKVTGPQRQLLEEVFQCKVADWYSSREFGTIAFPCEAGGLHVCETRLLEIIAKGQVAQSGQLGEVVITSLHQFGMPFIRYKIGDVGVYEHNSCSCGRGMPVLREIAGRLVDFTVTPEGKIVHGAYYDYVFYNKPEVVRFQVYQPDRKHLEIRLVCKKKVDSAWLENVHKEFQSHFGPNMHILIQLVDEIKLTPAGKHRFIISEARPDFL